MVKNLHADIEGTGDTDLIPGSGRSSEKRNGKPFHYSLDHSPQVATCRTQLKRLSECVRAHSHTHTHIHTQKAQNQDTKDIISQVALVVKNLPANAGDVTDTGSIPGSGRCPGGGMATHSSTLAWRVSHGQRSLMGLQRVRHDCSKLVHNTHSTRT